VIVLECLPDDRTTDEQVAQRFGERSMSERSQRLRYTPMAPGVATRAAWLGSNCLMSVDEVISAVHEHAREICEQQLLSARGRLSDEQAHMTRAVVEAIVGRLLAVPEARMNEAPEERDYAELLAHLFELEPSD